VWGNVLYMVDIKTAYKILGGKLEERDYSGT
jgi:hypothetical protein